MKCLKRWNPSTWNVQKRSVILLDAHCETCWVSNGVTLILFSQAKVKLGAHATGRGGPGAHVSLALEPANPLTISCLAMEEDQQLGGWTPTWLVGIQTQACRLMARHTDHCTTETARLIALLLLHHIMYLTSINFGRIKYLAMFTLVQTDYYKSRAMYVLNHFKNVISLLYFFVSCITVCCI